MRTDLNSLLQFWNPSDPNNHDCNSFTLAQTDILWLYTEMEVKADEFKERSGRDMPKESLDRIVLLKRHAQWLAKLRYKFDALQQELSDLKQRNEYLTKQLPKVDMSNARIVLDNGRLVYKQTDNY